jgi:hypothetical protein
MVVVFPEPAIAPGLMIQFPAGNPLNTTPPVAVPQSGCIIELMDGAEGITGLALITILADADEIHPAAFVTV